MPHEKHVAWLKTNVAPRSVARRLARRAVEARLAACANLEGIESIYTWEGRLETAEEVRVVFKTDASRLRALYRFVEKNHPYEVPYIAWGKGEAVPTPYARWVTAATAGGRTRPRRAQPGRARPRIR